MKQLTYADIVKRLSEYDKGFVQAPEYDSTNAEIPYIFFADFSRYLTRIIEASNSPEKDENVRRSMAFVDAMINSDDIEVANLAEVEILEQLAQSTKTVDFCLSTLKGQALKRFKHVLKYWGVNRNI